jgi:dihydrodipicolinate synthase/N-acetylneuraminate lyase
VRQALDRAGFPGYPLIAGTATQNAEEAAQQLATAAEAGAQWGLVLAPGYFAGNTPQEGLVRWFTAVADRSPIPILLYAFQLPPYPFLPDAFLMSAKKKPSDTTTPSSPTTSPSTPKPTPSSPNTPT